MVHALAEKPAAGTFDIPVAPRQRREKLPTFDTISAFRDASPLKTGPLHCVSLIPCRCFIELAMEVCHRMSSHPAPPAQLDSCTWMFNLMVTSRKLYDIANTRGYAAFRAPPDSDGLSLG